MDDVPDPVGRLMDVELDAVDAQRRGSDDPLRRVLWEVVEVPAMGDDQHRRPRASWQPPALCQLQAIP